MKRTVVGVILVGLLGVLFFKGCSLSPHLAKGPVQDAYPMFPEHAPAGAMISQVPDSLIVWGPGIKLEDVYRHLLGACDRAGISERGTYAIDSTGFAVVCRMEHIDDKGRPADPRWGVGPIYEKEFGLAGRLEALAKSKPGRYREIVVLVAAHPPIADGRGLTPWEWRQLRSSGAQYLDDRLKSLVPDGYHCWGYVYEFETLSDGSARIVDGGRLTGNDHLAGAGLWTRRQLGMLD
jgi:hypothetical protein